MANKNNKFNDLDHECELDQLFERLDQILDKYKRLKGDKEKKEERDREYFIRSQLPRRRRRHQD